MRIKNKSNKNIKLIVTLVIILCALTAAVIIYKSNIINNSSKNNSLQDGNINNNPPTQEQIDAGEQQKLNNNQQQSTTISISISSLTIDNNYIHIRSSISGAVTNNGSCQLTLIKTSGESLIKTVATYAMPSSSTCRGFDVDRAELSNGTWTAEIKVTSGDQTASASKDFTLE